MSKYITPEIKISIFNVENIVTTSTKQAVNDYITEKNIKGVANFSNSVAVENVLSFN